MSPADLTEKTSRYEQMLAEALDVAHPVSDSDQPNSGGIECLEMASAYLQDGRHFVEAGDLVNALAAFSYGHGWLDAAARMGTIDVPDDSDLFTI